MGRKKALPPNHLGRKAYGFRGTTQLRGTEPRTRFPDNGGRPVRAFPRGSSRANTAAPDRPACSRRPVLSWAGFLRRTSRSKHFNTPFISYSAGTCKRKLQKKRKKGGPAGSARDCQKSRIASAFGKEDSYERNPSGASFVFNHRIFRTFYESFENAFPACQKGFLTSSGRTRRVRPMSCYSSTLWVTSLFRCTAP